MYQHCIFILSFFPFILADCGPLFTDPSSSSLSVSYNSTVQGSVAMYSCITGYNLMGNQYSVCLNNASWSYNNPYCVLVGELKITDIYSIVLYNRYTFD